MVRARLRGGVTRTSLTRRFLLTLLLSAALPLVAFGWFALAGMRERMEQRIGEVYLPQVASEAALRIAGLIDEVRRSLALLVAPAAAALNDAARLPDFEAQVRLLPGVHQDFDLIVLAATDGRLLQAHLNPGLDPTTRQNRMAQLPDRVADEPWFAAINTGRGEVWLDRHLSPFLHRNPENASRDPADYHLGLALPVPASATGSLFALVRWERVQQVLDATAAFLRAEGQAALPSADCFLSDADGSTLAHTDRARYGAVLAPLVLRDGVRADPRGVLSFTGSDGDVHRVGFAAIANLPGGLRWWFGLDVREAELFSSSREFARLLSLAIVGLLLVLVVWSLVAARAIVRPLRAFAQATKRIAAGDLAVRVGDGGSRELAELGRAFNQMAEQLALGREQLRHAERQAAWAEMARQVAHEIKNPLTPMRMSAQLLQRARREGDARWPEIADRLAKTVQDQTEMLAAIATEFRAFAGPAALERVPLAVDGLLESAVALLRDAAAAQGAAIELRVEPKLPGLVGDAQQLRRVFVNLTQNALEAGAHRVVIRAGVASDRVRIAVADDGPGVPAEVRARLFEPYFTSKSSGTGLGLAICRRMVEAHGGEITLERTAPGETVFVVSLPRAA